MIWKGENVSRLDTDLAAYGSVQAVKKDLVRLQNLQFYQFYSILFYQYSMNLLVSFAINA